MIGQLIFKILNNMEYRKYICIVCGWIYDEAEGHEEDGLAPGTRWEDIPDDWECPDCGVTKEDFELLEE
jgi:rubredoxin